MVCRRYEARYLVRLDLVDTPDESQTVADLLSRQAIVGNVRRHFPIAAQAAFAQMSDGDDS